MSAPSGYNSHNLLGNVCTVIADRTGKSDEHVAHLVAEFYGGGDYDAAESALWDFRFGKLCDEIQNDLGLEWE